MVLSSSSPREIATTSTSVLSIAKSGPMLVCISRLSSSSPTTSGRRSRRRSCGDHRSHRSSPRTSPAARRTRSSCRRARRRERPVDPEQGERVCRPWALDVLQQQRRVAVPSPPAPVVPNACAVQRDEWVETVHARRHGSGHLKVGVLVVTHVDHLDVAVVRARKPGRHRHEPRRTGRRGRREGVEPPRALVLFRVRQASPAQPNGRTGSGAQPLSER
ncbi:Os04g0278100 [Oryza sativa Japonica Group]|uniref:Os04g0278100 protein n=1 Tax=Oryza sativa subsp. japonica TaxID=39947 RepID=A0A0P0W8E9_ORYSJ|nr:Os04g0278100 [Oryza sativa Japonica Group]